MRPRPFGRGYPGRGVHRDHRELASMRPRPFGRGYHTPGTRPARRCPRFNEATTFRPWIPWPRRTPRSPRVSFNEATTFRPWIPYKNGVFRDLTIDQHRVLLRSGHNKPNGVAVFKRSRQTCPPQCERSFVERTSPDPSQPTAGLYHQHLPVHWRNLSPQGLHCNGPATICRTDVDDNHPVLMVIDDVS